LTGMFERDIEFKNFLVGVWNMDIVQIGKQEFCGQHTNVFGKNSREQWKLENHKTLFGEMGGGSIVAHNTNHIPNGKPPKEPINVNTSMPAAGGKLNWDPSTTKGVKVQGELGQRRSEAAKGQTMNFSTNEELLERVRQRIRARGARGIIGIGRSFKIMDDDGSRSLNNAEFAKALRDYRISKDK